MSIVTGPLVSDLAKIYRTLGDLRSELQTVLGMGAQGQAAGVNLALINSHLRSAQYQLYMDFDWHTLIRYEDLTLGTDATRLDYPSFMDAERLLQVGVLVSNAWREVHRGITLTMYNTQTANPGPPYRFEQYDQIEFWPAADTPYTIRIWGIKALPRFTEDNDRPIIDDQLILLWATATLKAHYGKKDAPVAANQVERLRVRLRAKSWKQRVFDPNVGVPAMNDWEPLPKPVVIGR
jgi:hypothetical protein